MDNQQRRLQQTINLDGIDVLSITLHKKWLNTNILKSKFIQTLHTISREEMVLKFNIPNLSVFNAIVLKLYAAYTYLPLPSGFIIANLESNSKYAVNKDGVVITRNTRKIATPYTDEYGYLRVNTRHTKMSGKKAIYERLHRLLGKTFLPLATSYESMEINHKNGNKQDNNLTNLEWITKKDNLDHAWKTGLRVVQVGVSNGASKLSNEDVLQIRELFKTGKYLKKDLALQFNISNTSASDIINGKIWKHLL